MSEIKVYISYEERTNTRGYRNFTIEDAVPEVGDTFHGEEVKTVEEIKPDIQNNDEVFSYDYYVVKATQDGEYNEDDDIGMMYFIAVERSEDGI